MAFGITHHLESEEHQHLRHTVSKFVEKEVAPIAARMDEEDYFPEEVFKEMGQMGLTGMLIPEEYGGIGEDLLSAVIILEEISKESPALALSLLAHSILGAYPIVKYGTPQQKEKYLPALAEAKYIGALAYTEPGAGSDAAAISMSARREGDHYILNGQKTFITNGSVADVIITYAKTRPEMGRDGISAFIVERTFPGFSVSKKLNKMGMRGSPTALLFYDDVKVPSENLLGEENRGFYMVAKGFEVERITISAISIGIAERALRWMVNYSKERHAFGKPIRDFQLIQEKVARIGAKLETVKTYLYTLARYYDPRRDNRKESATVKYMAAKLGVEAGLEAIQVLGGNGYIREYPVERLMRDAKLMDIGAGTTEIMTIQIAKMIYREF